MEKGEALTIEAGRMLDGSEPVFEYLNELVAKATTGPQRRRGRALQTLSEIAVTLETFAGTGVLIPEREIKQLRGELWELKIGSVRLPFYRQAKHPRQTAVRLTSGFTKDWPHEHPQKLVRFAQKVHREDEES